MSNSDWIKPSDQLPDENQHVLVTTDAGFIDTGWFYGDYWSIGEGFYYETHEILAWQPLPDPYKAGEEE